MSATVETIPQAVGDWTLRGVRARGYDLMFAPDELSDSALSAASRTQAKFNSPFPAWSVYRTVVNGTTRHLEEITKYATGVGLALMLGASGRIRKPGVWVVEASQDAMARTIQGSFPAPALWRARDYAMSDKTYSRVRVAIAREYMGALESFQSILHEEARKVLGIDRGIR